MKVRGLSGRIRAGAQHPQRNIGAIIVANGALRRWASSSTAPTNAQNFDVVIVGGGPAGLALACALTSPGRSRTPGTSSLSVALVEASDLNSVRHWAPETRPDNFSNRVSSITNASRAFLQDIGAWEHVDEPRTNPIEEMQVWDGLSDARIEFNASSIASLQTGEMARLTENINLQRGLLRQIDKRISAGTGVIALLDKTKVLSITDETASTPSISSSGSGPLLNLSNSQTIRARLLVGADGPNSPVRTYSRIETYGWAYPARAIVATLEHHGSLTSFGTPRKHTTAYQRFLPTGPIAFLPVSSKRASLVWSTTPEMAQALLDGGVEEGVLSLMVNAAFRLPDVSMDYLRRFVSEKWATREKATANGLKWLTAREVEEEIGWRERSHGIAADDELTGTLTSLRRSSAINGQGDIPLPDGALYPPLVESIQVGSAASFPLRMAHADTYIGVRTALVGDAAHTVHPLAGQGLNLGLADAQSLVATIRSAVQSGSDVGSALALQRYEEERYLANHNMLSAVDKLHKVYGTREPAIVWARSVGLEVVNEWGALKEAIMTGAGANASGAAESGPGTHAPAWPVGIARVILEGTGSIMDGARMLLGAGSGKSTAGERASSVGTRRAA